MVTMRDGIRLATDVYRPGREGELVDGRYPTIIVHHPVRQDRAPVHRDRRLLRPARLCRRAPGHARPPSLRGHEGVLPQRDAAHRRGRLRHDRVDRRAALEQRPHRDGRQLVRGDHAGPRRARAPAAPDGDLARRRADEHVPAPDARGRRDAAAHVLGALHPRRRRPGRARATGRSRRRSGTTCGTCGSSSGSSRTSKGTLALRHVPALDRDARGLHDPRRLRRVVGEEGERLHPLLARARRHPGRRCRRAGSTASPTPTPSTSARWRRRARRRSGCSSGRGATSGCAATSTYTLDVDFGPDSRWGVQRYFEEQLDYFDRWLQRGRRSGAGWAPDGKPVRIFVMGGGSGRRTAARQARPRRPLARRGRVAARTRPADVVAPPRRRVARAGAAGGRGRAEALHLRPRRPGADDRRPLLRGRRVPAGGRSTSSRCGRASSTRRSGCGTS